MTGLKLTIRGGPLIGPVNEVLVSKSILKNKRGRLDSAVITIHSNCLGRCKWRWCVGFTILY